VARSRRDFALEDAARDRASFLQFLAVGVECFVIVSPGKILMSHLLRFGIAVLMVSGTSLFAQSVPLSAEKKQEPSASTATSQAPTGSADYGCGQQTTLDVLSDTRGVDFGPYLARVAHDVRMNWSRVIPESAKSPVMKKGKACIEFAILKDGRISGMKLVYSSGDVALDRAAWAGITASRPFRPLPVEFPGLYLTLRLKFLYNPSAGDAKAQAANPDKRSYIVVSPGSVELASGARQQFSVSVEGSAKPVVIWNVSCAASFCGTISPEGLYTAPSNIPNPTTVTVLATVASDPLKTDSAIVTIQPGLAK
jgi:TonB family protein